jgi:hypothetical protein
MMKLWKKSGKDTATAAVPVPVTGPKDTQDKELPWVNAIQNVVRPAVAVIVLVMCAPGEHYLAHMVGWGVRLSWGMPAVLTMYAGVAAVVATKRDKGAPGKRTAVAGAIVSIVIAMAAQPIAHLYQLGLISGHLTELTIVVSCIPALVFGHLLHLAASPASVRVLSRAAGVLSPVPAIVPPVLSQDSRSAAATSRDKDSVSSRLPNAVPAPVLPAGDTVPAVAATGAVSQDTPRLPDGTALDRVPPVPVRRTADGSITSFAQDILSRGEDTDNATLKSLILEQFGQDTKDNTINTGIRRARQRLGLTA